LGHERCRADLLRRGEGEGGAVSQASAVREQVEGSGQSLLTIHRRIDALVFAAEEANARLDRLSEAVEVVAAMVSSLAEPEHAVALDEALATLRDEAFEQAAMIDRAAEEIRRHTPEALEAFIRKLDAEKHDQPVISTDRSPRRRRTIIEGQKTKTGEIIAPDGRVLGHERK
jgi:hypothetical protein